MEIRTSTVAIVAASCITVGAAGAFIASRPARAPQSPATVTDVAAAGVEQSEAVVADAPVEQVAETASVSPEGASASRRSTAPPPVAARAITAPATTRSTPAPPSRPAPRSQVAAVPVSAPRVPDPAAVLAPPPPVSRSVPSQPTVPEPAVALGPVEPRGPKFLDLVVATDSVLGLQIESPLTSEKARVEDEVVARVTRDVRVGDRVAIPAGSQARGEVTVVERGGKMRDRARLGVRFTSVVLADGTRVPIETDTIYREGDSPGAESTAKIGGGAIGGAIIGGIFGGAKGAAIGAATGAGAGTAAVVAGGRNAATLPSGTPVTVRLVQPATVTVEE